MTQTQPLMSNRIGSLFSGYGGLDLAVQAVLGATVAWHCEIEPAAQRLLAHHHPDVPNLDDITAVDWAAVEPVDVLTGGFPCQDVSAAGRRAGIRQGTRSGLWNHMADAIDRLRPGLVVIENVRGLLSAHADSALEPCPWCLGDGPASGLRALGAVLGDLADLGYDARWGGLRAADVGAPHGRYRVFIAATPEDADGAAGSERRLAAPGQTAGGWSRADAGGRGGAPADAGSDGTGREGAVSQVAVPHGQREAPDGPGTAAAERRSAVADAMRDGREGRSERDLRPEAGQSAPLGGDPARRVLGTTGAGGRSAASDAASDGERQEHPSDDGFEGERPPVGRGAVEPAGTGRDRAAGDGRAAGAPASGRGDAGGDPTAGPVAWGDYAPAIRRWELILGRPAPAPTQTGKRGGQQLSPLFVEWMQGLPVGHVTGVPGLSRNEQLKMLGNGVVPQQAAAALQWLLTPNVLAVAA